MTRVLMTKTFLSDRTIMMLISFRNDDVTSLTDDTIVNEKPKHDTKQQFFPGSIHNKEFQDFLEDRVKRQLLSYAYAGKRICLPF